MIQGELRFTKAIKAKYYPSVTRRLSMYSRILAYLEVVEDVTNRELARHLGAEICSITPRIFELRMQGHVVFAGTRKCAVTQNKVSAWRLK